MQKYDKVWVPSSFDESNAIVSSGGKLLSDCAKTETNVIVLSIDEAHDLWSAGHKRGWAECLHGEEESSKPDFESYMKHKGITLP